MSLWRTCWWEPIPRFLYRRLWVGGEGSTAILVSFPSCGLFVCVIYMYTHVHICRQTDRHVRDACFQSAEISDIDECRQTDRQTCTRRMLPISVGISDRYMYADRQTDMYETHSSIPAREYSTHTCTWCLCVCVCVCC